MKSFNEIMAKVAGKLPPELAVNAARVKQVQDPSRPGAETPPKSSLKMVAKMQPNKPQPKTASVSDDLDRGFVSWMEKKAGEDVVKVASTASDLEKYRDIMMKSAPDKVEPGVLKLLKRRGAIGGAKGALLGSALTAGAGALYLKGRKDQHAKTAGVVENRENLDLLDLIKKRMAAGSAMVGDV